MVLKITEAKPLFGRIMVADYLPAGFEIDNPRIWCRPATTGTLDWIEDAEEPVRIRSSRDDRFSAAFDRASDDSGGVHGGLCGAGRVARPICAAAGLVEDMAPTRCDMATAPARWMIR